MGKVELIVVGVQRGEQVEHFVVHFVRARVRTIDLVDDDDGAKPARQRFHGHEFGLRHGAFGGVHQHDHAVDHRHDALDLAAEIGVAGRVDDVDANALPHDRGAFGENGDPAFAFEVVGVHRAFGHLLVGAERAGLLQKLIDQGGFAVVDMRDDRDVTNIHM